MQNLKIKIIPEGSNVDLSIIDRALESEKVKNAIGNKIIKEVVIVKNKLINFVTEN